MAPKKSEDSRKSIRLLALNLVSFTYFNEQGDSEDTGMGRTLDLSTGGIKLEVNRNYPISSEIEINLQIKENIIRARGVVAHVDELKNGKIGIGVRFSKITEHDRDTIQDFLATI